METISSGLSPFSKNLTAWLIGFGSPMSSPDSRSSSTTLALALNTVLPAMLRIGGLGGIRGDDIRGVGDDAAVAADDGAVGQVELAPPDHVGDVAEGADHRDAAALVLLGEVVGEHRHLDAEDRGGHGRAEQGLVAFVIRMRDQRHAGRQQLRAGGLDVHVGAVRAVEGDPVVGGG